jgi:hypothetical protein
MCKRFSMNDLTIDLTGRRRTCEKEMPAVIEKINAGHQAGEIWGRKKL